MRILHFDAFSGISGDMTVGALLDLGADFEKLRQDLAQLPVNGYALRAGEKFANGIRAVKFDVDIDVPAHDHGHTHTHVGEPEGHHSHGHTAYREIRSMLENGSLADGVKKRALAIFARLAEAEAKVHGVADDDVSFHEVGAIDSIVDIVGAAHALDQLGVERITVSPLPVGSGLVKSEHGVIPVPGPATVELLRGFPIRVGDGNGELVTPTGAAILAALATPGEPAPPMIVERIGYGAGTKTWPDRPNLLRALLGRPTVEMNRDELVLIEANIDDANPEIFDHVMERLYSAGARDVWFTPIQMKKNRPGTLLGVLADAGSRDALAAIVLSETTSIGVRFRTVERLTLPREVLEVETKYGPVLVKLATDPEGRKRCAPEYDSCRAAAQRLGLPIRVIYDAAMHTYQHLKR